MKRVDVGANNRLRFDRFLFDRDDERVVGPDGPIHMGHKAFLVLEALIERDGRLLTKDELFETVWDGSHVSESALTSVIKELRRALGEGTRETRIIESVYGRGYRLLARVEPETEPNFSIGAPSLQSMMATRETLLAVLPFDNLTDDADFTYFCDGVSAEIQRTVASSSELKVVGRSSSFQFRGGDKTTAKVAAALGSSHLLDGSVRRSGSFVRIDAELVDCTTQSAIWGDRFEGDLEDAFELQDTIAQAVAKALKVALAPKRKERSVPPDLYEEFIRARAWIAEGDATFDDSAKRAIPLLEKVTGGATDFAAAWELLAIARAWTLRTGLYEGPYAQGRDSVIAAAQTALDLDPRRGGAYAALAMLEPWGAYAAREALLLEALEASPHDPAILTDMSNFCWSVGRFRESLALAERACELNPLMPSAQLHVSQMRLYTGDYAGGIEMHLRIRRRWPDNSGILLSLVNSASFLNFWDAYDEAVPHIGRFGGWQGKDMRAAKAYAEAKRTLEPALVERRVGRYVQLLEDTGTLPLNLIISIAALGKVEFALDLAEKASYDYVFDPEGARPSIYYPGTVLGPWSEVMKVPRFVRLCQRLGLAEYWVETDAWPDSVEWAPYDFKAEVRRIVSLRTTRSAAP